MSADLPEGTDRQLEAMAGHMLNTVRALAVPPLYSPFTEALGRGTLPLVPNPSGPGVRPEYVPAPLADGMARVVLDDEGCNGEPADFHDYDSWPVLARPHEVFDVPVGQLERWRAAKEAFQAMTGEIEALIEERARGPRER